MYPPHGPPIMSQPGYQPFNYAPHPSQQLPPGPVPVGYDPDAYTTDYSGTKHSKSKRRQSAPSSSQPPTLKPALKQSRAAPTPMVHPVEFPTATYYGPQQSTPYGNTSSSGYPLSRTRTSSVGHERRRASSNAAPHDIDPPFQPCQCRHLLLTNNRND